jgi:hypothetical protein
MDNSPLQRQLAQAGLGQSRENPRDYPVHTYVDEIFSICQTYQDLTED